MTAFVANTNLLELSGLQDAIDDSYINDATVTATLKDSAGADVGGITWPLTLAYVDGSDGDYRAVLVAALELANRGHYTAVIEVDAGEDRVGHYEFPFRAATRTTE